MIKQQIKIISGKENNMKSKVVSITSEGTGMAEALAMTETIGAERGLNKKQSLHLRLLAEELLGMLHSITGKIDADYWIAAEGKNVEIHMKSDIKLTPEMRDQIVSASTSGKNDAARGIMGKIKVMIAGVLLSAKDQIPYAMINTVSAIGGNAGETSTMWSMSSYKNELEKHAGDSKNASEAWDELEKSIIANIADEIKVGIVGKTVEITVFKSF